MQDSVVSLGPEDLNQLEKLLLDGGEFLKQHRVAEARQMFSQALAVDPNNTRALGLLGLVCFRMNDFESALPVYERLVRLHQGDASFALNLGLVHLKLGNAQGAIAELRRCRELDPSQSRAVSYLGLAYARNGQYAEAYQAFLQAGDEDLAREMEQYLSDNERERIKGSVAHGPVTEYSIETPLPASAPAVAAEASPDDQAREAIAQLFAPVNTVEISADDVEVVEEEEVSFDESEVATEPAESAEEAVPAERPTSVISQAVALALPSTAATVGVTKVAEGNQPPMPLFEFATAKLIRPEDGEHPFELSAGGVLIVRVRGRVFTRTEGVNITGGELAYEVAQRRVRGSATSDSFMTDGRPMFMVSGRGHLLAAPLGEHFTAVTLDDDILYLREDLVFSFEDQLRWENGKVPGSGARIPMVQFRGHGSLAFRSRLPLLSIKLPPEGVLHVDAHVLAGWIGRVIPRAVSPVGGGDKSTLFVECTGEGVILVEDESGDDARAASDSSRPVLAGARRIEA